MDLNFAGILIRLRFRKLAKHQQKIERKKLYNHYGCYVLVIALTYTNTNTRRESSPIKHTLKTRKEKKYGNKGEAHRKKISTQTRISSIQNTTFVVLLSVMCYMQKKGNPNTFKRKREIIRQRRQSFMCEIRNYTLNSFGLFLHVAYTVPH